MNIRKKLSEIDWDEQAMYLSLGFMLTLVMVLSALAVWVLIVFIIVAPGPAALSGATCLISYIFGRIAVNRGRRRRRAAD